MKNVTALLLCIALVSSATADEEDFRTFFEEWVALEHAFDPAVVDQYADDASIHTLRRTGEGTEQSMKLDGRKWKELLRSTLDLARQRGDRSEYSDVAVTVSDGGDRATIRATRYSAIKCFTDRAYYMVVERRDAGLRIVEEYSESTAESLCEPSDRSDDLASMIEAVVRVANSQIELPILVDEETRLEAIRAVGEALEYQFTLVNYAAEELDREALAQNLQPGVVLQVCSQPSLKRLLDGGASTFFRYRGNDAEEVAAIRVTHADCQTTVQGEAPGGR